MRMMAAMMLVTMATPAAAQMPACPTPAPLPAELAGWTRPVATREGGTLAIGRAGDVKLGTGATFAVAPEKTPSAGTFGASLGFTVTRAGTYRVALGGPVWIDVVRDGKPVASSAHGHGPACSPVRKMVDFALTPGAYRVQLSGAKTPTARIIVARLP